MAATCVLTGAQCHAFEVTLKLKSRSDGAKAVLHRIAYGNSSMCQLLQAFELALMVFAIFLVITIPQFNWHSWCLLYLLLLHFSS